MKSLNIIGCGKVGKTLGYLLAQARAYKIQSLFSRTLSSAEEAARFIGSGQAVGDMSKLKPADVYMIASSDDSIATSAEQLADIQQDRLESKIVFHCSGALSSHTLFPLKNAGAYTASLHPVISIAEPKISIHKFLGTYCGIEGDIFACEELKRSFTLIGCETLKLASDKKSLYHAAAVLSSNYIVSLIEASMQTYKKAGIEDNIATILSLSLAKNSLDNISAVGTTRALTGPIARGDIEIVKTHLAVLSRCDKDIALLYEAFIKITEGLAKKQEEKV